jgi:ATP-dependent DNA helicase DinG
VPALQHLVEGGERVVIATRTIALQEQLIERDIPFLLDVLDLPRLQVALAKGRGNYIFRRRASMAEEEGARLFESAIKQKQLRQLLAWAEVSEDGSLASAPIVPDADVWELARAEAGNCLHKRCSFYATCAYQASRRRMYSASLIVANHALVLSDLALRLQGVSILPDYEVLILDEAHELEDGAAEHFGAQVTQTALARQLGRFSRSGKRSGLFERVEVGRSLFELLEKTRAASKGFFGGIEKLRGEKGELRLKVPGGFDDSLSGPLGDLVEGLKGDPSHSRAGGSRPRLLDAGDRPPRTVGAARRAGRDRVGAAPRALRAGALGHPDQRDAAGRRLLRPRAAAARARGAGGGRAGQSLRLQEPVPSAAVQESARPAGRRLRAGEPRGGARPGAGDRRRRVPALHLPPGTHACVLRAA